MQYKAIIFDMDGVLFETEDFYFKRRADFLASQGISIAHLDVKVFVGGRSSMLWELILGEAAENWDIPALEERYQLYKEAHPTPYGELVFPEAKKVIPALRNKGLKLVVASNTDREDIERALKEAGLSTYFDAIFSATDCTACKPDPAVYEAAWESLGVPKSETLVVEDSEMGIAAGRAADLDVWAIRDYKWGVNQEGAQKLIDNLTELADRLQQGQTE